MRFGLRLAERGVVMESGRVLLDGKADEVLANPEMSALYFGGTVENVGHAHANDVGAHSAEPVLQQLRRRRSPASG